MFNILLERNHIESHHTQLLQYSNLVAFYNTFTLESHHLNIDKFEVAPKDMYRYTPSRKPGVSIWAHYKDISQCYIGKNSSTSTAQNKRPVIEYSIVS